MHPRGRQPGNSLIEVDRIIDERRPRNENLASTMRELGICEERGGGIDKTIIEIKMMSLPAPEFFASKDSMRVVLFGPRKFNQLSKAGQTMGLLLPLRCSLVTT